MRTDLELVQRYVAGDEDSFAAFYDRHCRSLYVYLLAIVGTRETAEELLQETFIAFLGRLDAITLKNDMRPYLFTAARHLAVDHLRRERRGREAIARRLKDPFFRARTVAPVVEDAPAADPEELSGLVHRLPQPQREAVVLRALAGWTYREIAELAGVPENTVVSRYRYGIEKLRTMALYGGSRGKLA